MNAQAELSLKQQEKCREIVEALEKEGFTGFTITPSRTAHGTSTYIQGNLDLKFRISDHSLLSDYRKNNEVEFDFSTPTEMIINVAKEAAARWEKINYRLSLINRKHERMMGKWEKIKEYFKDYVFLSCDRTYQDFESFSKSGATKKYYLLQLPTPDGKAFTYEWAEKKGDRNLFSIYHSNRPSKDWINQFDEKSGTVSQNLNVFDENRYDLTLLQLPKNFSFDNQEKAELEKLSAGKVGCLIDDSGRKSNYEIYPVPTGLKCRFIPQKDIENAMEL